MTQVGCVKRELLVLIIGVGFVLIKNCTTKSQYSSGLIRPPRTNEEGKGVELKDKLPW